MPEERPKARLFDFPQSLRVKYAELDRDISEDGLTEKEREFLRSQIAEANERKKRLATGT